MMLLAFMYVVTIYAAVLTWLIRRAQDRGEL